MHIDINTLKVIRKKKPRMTDPIRYPKVIKIYESQFKKDYISTLQNMTMMIANKTKEFV